MDIFAQISKGLPSWIPVSIIAISGLIYLVSKVRANDMKILRETNRDQGDRISLLEKSVKRLEDQIIDLQHKNQTLNDLVVVALKQYFFENPKVADSMKQVLLKQ